LETFAAPKKIVDNPEFQSQRQKYLAGLESAVIDAPILEIVHEFSKHPFCFTMQSCYGHFLYDGQRDPYNLAPLPFSRQITTVTYKIAYLAFGIENSTSGSKFLACLDHFTEIDPDYIQLCSAEWFWERQVNSYALQVEPDRFKHKDSVIIEYAEALHIESIRNRFYEDIANFNWQSLDSAHL